MRRSLVLFVKQWRQQVATALASGTMLVGFAGAVVLSLRAFGELIQEQMMTRISILGMREIFFGGAPEGTEFLGAYLSLAYTHPLVLLVVCTFAIAVASRALAGEIERGTIDVLLATPVTRLQFALASGAAMAAGLLLLLGVHGTGLRLGLRLTDAQPTPATLAGLGWAGLNLGALALAVGGYAFLFSALTSERGRAAGLAAGVTVASYFFNVLAQLWPKAQFMQHVSLFHYHRPLPILATGAPAWGDLAVLGTVAALAFIAAWWVFVRRDIVTV